MGIILEIGLTNELKIKFIDEIVILNGLNNLKTSSLVVKNEINIKMDNNENLRKLINSINQENLKIKINNEDTIIVLS
jgi:hypothetical protein